MGLILIGIVPIQDEAPKKYIERTVLNRLDSALRAVAGTSAVFVRIAGRTTGAFLTRGEVTFLLKGFAKKVNIPPNLQIGLAVKELTNFTVAKISIGPALPRLAIKAMKQRT
jgi:hypothetical protein